jgi:hypothetical protein
MSQLSTANLNSKSPANPCNVVWAFYRSPGESTTEIKGNLANLLMVGDSIVYLPHYKRRWCVLKKYNKCSVLAALQSRAPRLRKGIHVRMIRQLAQNVSGKRTYVWSSIHKSIIEPQSANIAIPYPYNSYGPYGPIDLRTFVCVNMSFVRAVMPPQYIGPLLKDGSLSGCPCSLVDSVLAEYGNSQALGYTIS